MTFEQLERLGKGYDHNWVLKSTKGDVTRRFWCAYPLKSGSPSTGGIVLDVHTNEPGIQIS